MDEVDEPTMATDAVPVAMEVDNLPPKRLMITNMVCFSDKLVLLAPTMAVPRKLTMLVSTGTRELQVLCGHQGDWPLSQVL